MSVELRSGVIADFFASAKETAKKSTKVEK